MIPRPWRWLPVIALSFVIYQISDMPHLHVYDGTSLSPYWRNIVKQYTFHVGTKGFFSYVITPHPEFVLRKLGHAVVYASLGIACYLAVRRARMAMLISIAYAVFDELHQGLVDGRSCRFWDMVLDSAAACMAIWLVNRWYCNRKANMREKEVCRQK